MRGRGCGEGVWMDQEGGEEVGVEVDQEWVRNRGRGRWRMG